MSDAMLTHIAIHDLYEACVGNTRKLTPEEFAKNLQTALNDKYDTRILFSTYDLSSKKCGSVCIEKKIGFFRSEITVLVSK